MTLIAFGTRYGSTEECVSILKPELNDKNIKILKLGESKDKIKFDDYDSIIIGGQINAGKLNNKVKKFIDKNIDSLLSKKIGLFITCLEPVDTAAHYFDLNFPKILSDKAAVKSCFGGAIYFERLSFIERPILKMIAKTSENINRISTENIKKFASAFNKK
jgi:menaquinone-dependent protoporphyrinogen oxidase